MDLALCLAQMYQCILKTEEFCITLNVFPPFHVYLEKCRIKCPKNLQSLMSVSGGQALPSNSVEQGAVLIPHLLSFINLFYKDQLQVETRSQCVTGKNERARLKELSPISRSWMFGTPSSSLAWEVQKQTCRCHQPPKNILRAVSSPNQTPQEGTGTAAENL